MSPVISNLRRCRRHTDSGARYGLPNLLVAIQNRKRNQSSLIGRPTQSETLICNLPWLDLEVTAADTYQVN